MQLEMKQSDSSTSLSKLVVSDTACLICKQGEGDEEAATKGELRESSEFGSSCTCRFSFHTECMGDWLRLHPNECPLCSVRLLHHKVEEVIGGQGAVVDTSYSIQKSRPLFPGWLKWTLAAVGLGSVCAFAALVITNSAGK